MSDLAPYAPHELLSNAVQMWAAATTSADTPRRADLLRDKTRALLGDGDGGSAAGFFVVLARPIQDITPADVSTWIDYLQQHDLAPATIYAMVSRVSAFYTWLMDEPALGLRLAANPVRLARPTAPKPYQSERTKALTDKQVRQLMAIVKARAATGDLVGLRDYALLRFYLATGKRREEIIELVWGDLEVQDDEGLVISTHEKGGYYRATEISDPGVWRALKAYLVATGRLDTLGVSSPLWLRHDNAVQAADGEQSLGSQGFVRNLKRYALEAGIGDVHLHQTRHWFANAVGAESGSAADVQQALNHRNITTTRTYLERIAVKHDRWSQRLAARLQLDEDDS